MKIRQSNDHIYVWVIVSGPQKDGTCNENEWYNDSSLAQRGRPEQSELQLPSTRELVVAESLSAHKDNKVRERKHFQHPKI